MDSYAGDFSLATSVEGHPSGTLVHVTVQALHPSRLVLDFSDHQQVLTDASVLLAGDTGASKLLELGYTGPLTKRPQLTGSESGSGSDRSSALARNLSKRQSSSSPILKRATCGS